MNWTKSRMSWDEYVLWAVGFGLIGVLVWVVFSQPVAPYKVGQMVCLPNGARGTVQNITAYRTTVLTTDNLNRMYTVEVIHDDIVECK